MGLCHSGVMVVDGAAESTPAPASANQHNNQHNNNSNNHLNNNYQSHAAVDDASSPAPPPAPGAAPTSSSALSWIVSPPMVADSFVSPLPPAPQPPTTPSSHSSASSIHVLHEDEFDDLCDQTLVDEIVDPPPSTTTVVKPLTPAAAALSSHAKIDHHYSSLKSSLPFSATPYSSPDGSSPVASSLIVSSFVSPPDPPGAPSFQIHVSSALEQHEHAQKSTQHSNKSTKLANKHTTHSAAYSTLNTPLAKPQGLVTPPSPTSTSQLSSSHLSQFAQPVSRSQSNMSNLQPPAVAHEASNSHSISRSNSHSPTPFSSSPYAFSSRPSGSVTMLIGLPLQLAPGHSSASPSFTYIPATSASAPVSPVVAPIANKEKQRKSSFLLPPPAIEHSERDDDLSVKSASLAASFQQALPPLHHIASPQLTPSASSSISTSSHCPMVSVSTPVSSPHSPPPMFRARTIETHQVQFSYTEAGQKKINQYVVESTLGRGSYGQVRLVFNTENQQHYAMKIMQKSWLKKRKVRGFQAKGQPEEESIHWQNVQREIAIMKKLDHPNIVKLFEVMDDVQDDQLYLVMEYLEHGPVFKVEARGRQKPLERGVARHYIRDAIQGLEYLHAQRVIHRDIKPENLLLSSSSRVKITDFGVSLLFDDGPQQLDACGSAAFMPPELCGAPSARQHITHSPLSPSIAPQTPNSEFNRSKTAGDVWSLGVTLYVFIFGCLPFTANTIPLLYEKICHDKVHYDDEFMQSVNSSSEQQPNDDRLLFQLFSLFFDKSPHTRISIDELKSDEWITDRGRLQWELIMDAMECPITINTTNNQQTQQQTSNVSTSPFLLPPATLSHSSSLPSNLSSYRRVEVTQEEVKSALSLVTKVMMVVKLKNKMRQHRLNLNEKNKVKRVRAQTMQSESGDASHLLHNFQSNAISRSSTLTPSSNVLPSSSVSSSSSRHSDVLPVRRLSIPSSVISSSSPLDECVDGLLMPSSKRGKNRNAMVEKNMLNIPSIINSMISNAPTTSNTNSTSIASTSSTPNDSFQSPRKGSLKQLSLERASSHSSSSSSYTNSPSLQSSPSAASVPCSVDSSSPPIASSNLVTTSTSLFHSPQQLMPANNSSANNSVSNAMPSLSHSNKSVRYRSAPLRPPATVYVPAHHQFLHADSQPNLNLSHDEADEDCAPSPLPAPAPVDERRAHTPLNASHSLLSSQRLQFVQQHQDNNNQSTPDTP